MVRLAVLLVLTVSVSPAAVRIVYGESRPYNYTGRDGKPAGFLVELFNEAARREGLTLEWTRGGSPEENDKALVEGRLDILPMGVATAERRRILYVSEPWWTEDGILLVRADRKDVDLERPQRLAYPQRMATAVDVQYHPAQAIVTTSAAQALEHVCRKTADAALLGSTYIRDLINARPPVCESVALRVIDSHVTVELSIISSRTMSHTADRLRERIGELTADGTLTRTAGRYPPISTPYTMRMAEALQTRYESQRLRMMLVFLSAFAFAAALVLLRQVRAQKALRSIIHQQLRTEQELRESQAALSQRTSELVRSNEELQAFAYTVSHDLQEPLRNQSVYSELLERRHGEALPPEARQYLKVIRQSALRMQDMMKSLLVYSRVGHADRQKEMVDCGAVVKRVLADLQFLLDNAEARVEVGPLPRVWAWEDRLQQVFQNLIENAAKYRKAEVPPWITVSAEQVGGEWQFSVSDNGIGFKQDYAEKVFGLFKRLHGINSYGGSGIGLAVCKRIVERHGGRIWVESREGVGTTFRFTIPARQLDAGGHPVGEHVADRV